MCGLQPGETITLQLRPYSLELQDFGEPIFELAVGNEAWEQTGLDLEPGGYELSVATEGTDYGPSDRHGIGVPNPGIVWRYSRLDFTLHPADEMCEPPGPYIPPSGPPPPPPAPPLPGTEAPTVRECIPLPGTRFSFTPQLDGRLVGLKEDDVATILIFGVSRTEDGFYGVISPPNECEPEPLVKAPELSDAELAARMTLRGQVWGLLGDGLGVGRFLVISQATGYNVSPAAYFVDLPFNRVSTRVGGLDFTFAPELSE